jgi:hypothetical protein
MTPIVQLFAFLILGAVMASVGLRLFASNRRRAGEMVVALGLLTALFGSHAWHEEDKKTAAGKLGAALVILDDRLKAEDQTASLKIVDKGIRLFGASQVHFDKAADELWSFAINTEQKKLRR